LVGSDVRRAEFGASHLALGRRRFDSQPPGVETIAACGDERLGRRERDMGERRAQK
jgi:hypothetical protein